MDNNQKDTLQLLIAAIAVVIMAAIIASCVSKDSIINRDIQLARIGITNTIGR